MESGFQLQAAFVLLLLSLSKAQDVTGPSISCFRSRPADGQTRVTFLRQDTAGVRSLYLTMWSEHMTLVACQIFSSTYAAEGYRALCNKRKTWGQEVTQKFNISMVLTLDAPCALVPYDPPEFTTDGTDRKVRRKRAWILPGTMWCGSGSKAVGYEQLGMFEDADKCCREHDYCLHIIPAFSVNYGVFNPNLFTVSHCDCDQREIPMCSNAHLPMLLRLEWTIKFRQCLLGMNDSISHMVGYSFFNILQVPCFELKQLKRCTEMYWWGLCKRAKEAPYAIFKMPLPYNSSDCTSKFVHTGTNNLTKSERQNSTESPMIKLLRKSSKTERGCGLRDPPRGDTFHSRRIKGKGCKMHQKLSGVAPSQVPTVSRTHTTMLSMKMGPSKSSSQISNKKRAGKMKSFRKSSSGFEQRGHVPTKVPTIADQQMPSATPSSIPPLTLRLKLQLKPTPAVVGGNKNFRSHQKVTDHSRCGSTLPVRGDASHLHCKSSLKPETASNRTTVTLAETIKQNQQSSHKSRLLKKTTETPNQDTSLTFQSTVTLATPVTTKLRTMVSLHKDGKSQKLVNFSPLWNKTSQELLDSTIVQNIHAEKSRTQNSALRNMTDNQFQCQSLKHLDDCKFKIPPLEKKYNLQNIESKATYHCDCTSRLAVEIESFKQPSILPSLLGEFVSEQCFTLPKEKKCRRKKRCSHGFSKASDLHRALKKIEEKNAAGMGISSSDKKRQIPVRLYKRCLRLKKEADIAKLK